jgi:hypothetical protein
MTSSYRQEEERIAAAVRSLQGATCTNIASLAREFNCPLRRLRNRLAGAPSKLGNVNADAWLSFEQDLALKATLDRLEESGLPARVSMLASIANQILAQSNKPDTPHPKVSHMWASRWMKANPEYKIGIGKPLALARKNAHDPTAIRSWFTKYQAVIDERGIQPGDISNVDETGFRVGVGRGHKVITKDKTRKIYIPDVDDRQQVTVVECIQADGTSIPPMVILAGKTHLQKHFPPDLHDDILLAMSPTGYNNDSLCLKWLQHYDQHTRDKRVGRWRLLLFDGFGSHLLIDFISYCWDNYIIPICLPPHATHLMQPLDVVVFQPYKHYHSEVLDEANRSGCDAFDTVDFLAELGNIRYQTMKTSTICSAFRATGLVPFDPDVVLNRLIATQRQEAEFEDEDYSDLTVAEDVWLEQLQTPQTVRQLYIIADECRRLLDPIAITDELIVLDKLIRGAITQVEAGQLAISELTAVRNSIARRRTRSTMTGTRHVQKGGVITVSQARVKIVRRQQTESELAHALVAKEQLLEERAIAKAAERVEIESRKAARTLAAADRKLQLEAKRARRALQKLAREALKAA